MKWKCGFIPNERCEDCNIKLTDNIHPNIKSICVDCYDDLEVEQNA